MFFRNSKENNKQKKNTNPTLKNGGSIVYHSQEIIDGKLYDTEKSEIICTIGKETLFKTVNENYFLCDGDYCLSKYFKDECFLETWYRNITPIDLDKVKELLGKYNIKKYIELFGEPELA